MLVAKFRFVPSLARAGAGWRAEAAEAIAQELGGIPFSLVVAVFWRLRAVWKFRAVSGRARSIALARWAKSSGAIGAI